MSYGDKLLFLGQGKKCECEKRETEKFAITRPLRWCRKERATPLTGLTVAVLRAWLTENPGQAHDPLFPTRTGTRLSHDAIEHRLAVHLATARASCPSLRTKHATMHT